MSSGNGTPSIVELAAEMGVSHTTISRVINARPGVSPALAFQIRKRMREIGYTPREVRPGPRRREQLDGQPATARATGTIGFVHLGNAATTNLPANMINIALAASQAAAAAGYDLLFADVAGIDTLPAWLREGRVEGLMICGYRRDEALLELLDGFPSVWLSSHPSHGRAGDDGAAGRDRVLSGNYAVGQLAADYLVGRGHARVAVVNPLGGWQLFQTRGDAFDVTARRAGAAVTRLEGPSRADEVIFELDRVELEARVRPLVAALAAMPAGQRPTGVFCIDAPVALAVYRGARAAGLEVGRDLDVISFGSHLAFHGLAPMPATVAVSEETRGQRAVSQLLWRIGHPGERRGMEVSIDPQVVAGEIAWPPAAAGKN